MHDRRGAPLALVECKAPEVRIDRSTFEQAARYNSVFRVRYLMVTNGLRHYCCTVDMPEGAREFPPSAARLCGNGRRARLILGHAHPRRSSVVLGLSLQGLRPKANEDRPAVEGVPGKAATPPMRAWTCSCGATPPTSPMRSSRTAGG